MGYAALLSPRNAVQNEGASSCENLRNTALGAVPQTMELRPAMKTKFDKVPLFALNLDDDEEIKETPITGKDAILKHTENHGSVCFVVRRPG